MLESLSARVDSQIWNVPIQVGFCPFSAKTKIALRQAQGERNETQEHTRPRRIGQLTATSTLQSFMRSMRLTFLRPFSFAAVLRRCETGSEHQTAHGRAAHTSR